MEFLTLITILLFVFGMAKWCNEGETQVGNIYLKKDTQVDLYLGLYKNSSEPAEDATLANLTEHSGDGYARIALGAADWTEQAIKGVFENLQKTFTADGGDWKNICGYFITDVLTGTAGKLIAVEDFSDGPCTVNDGWSVKVTPRVTIA